jgi:LytR cell envelope-related transcriptional attenuator
MNKAPLVDPALDILEPSWESERLDVVDTFPIELPRSGSGLRAQRRRQQTRRRRRHQAGLGALAVSIVALLAAGLVEVTLRTNAERRVSAPAAPATKAVGTVPPTAVLVQQDAAGAAVSINVLVAGAGGRGGHVLLIPPGTMTELPSFGLDGLGRSLALGGPPLLQNALENLFGVKLDPVTVLKDPQLAALVRPAGSLTADLPARVESVDGAGRVSVLWDEGQVALAPDDVPKFLSVRGQGNDLARLVRHQVFWTSWLARMRQAPAAIPAAPDGLKRVVTALVAGPVSFDTLPVEAINAGAAGADVYRIRQADLDSLLRQALPGAPVGRIRVQILNGSGALGLAEKVAARLVPTGARVVLTGNASSFAYRQTQVVFYKRSKQSAALALQKALGAGKVVFSRNPLDVVDVTLVIGKDFRG